MIHIIKNKGNSGIELRCDVSKRDKGICCRCGKKGKTIIRSAENFDYIGYLTGTCKAEAASFITICAECNAKTANKGTYEGRVVPYLQVTAKGEIVECR